MRGIAAARVHAVEVWFATIAWVFIAISMEGEMEGLQLFALSTGAALLAVHALASSLLAASAGSEPAHEPERAT